MKFNRNQVKIRKTWGDMSPITRVVKDKSKYNRNKIKKISVDDGE
jgi:hypothetical protein